MQARLPQVVVGTPFRDDVRDVMFVSDYAMLTVGLDDAITHRDENQELMLEYLDQIIEAEAEMCGVDGSALYMKIVSTVFC